MPAAWALARPSAIWAPISSSRRTAIGRASWDGISSRSVWPSTTLHDDVGQAGGLADLVDGDDVGVVERGGGPRLLREAAHAARVGGELLGQELDRDVAVEVVVARAPDLAHPPRAQPGEELVASEPHADRGGHGARGPQCLGATGR